MPIYEYRCGACGYQKEFLQRLSDAPLTDCPECGKQSFNKLVTAAGFHLKGTGWYATDFKNSGSKPAAKQHKSQSKQDKSDTKQDKPETKQDKPAEKTGKEAPKAESATGGGATPAS
jgi:putative FmdB family regulatory protein